MAELTVRMPALSATMEDAELLSWLVAVGDEVRAGQPLAEVATDKVDMELESPHDGVVAELLAEPGQRVDLGSPVALLTSDEEDLLGDLDLGAPEVADTPSATQAQQDQPMGQDPSVAQSRPVEQGRPVEQSRPDARGREVEQPEGAGPADGRGIPLAPPPVRKRARALGIDLHQVTATGNRGQITHADLDAFVAERPAQVRAPGASRAGAPSAPSTPRRASSVSDGSRDRKAAIRRATARTTIRSAAIPQFTLYRGIDATGLLQRRGSRSVTTELARALAATLWRHPECNGVWNEEEERVEPLDQVRIGIAVDTPDGLVVVGVDDPDGVEPDEADARIKAAVARAREGKLTMDDTRDISSTISNLGGFGIDRFDALLVPPQPTILSVGRGAQVPVVIDGRVRSMTKIELGLTVDHRVADGADGARFLDTLVRRLES